MQRGPGYFWHIYRFPIRRVDEAAEHGSEVFGGYVNEFAVLGEVLVAPQFDHHRKRTGISGVVVEWYVRTTKWCVDADVRE
ncbi:hypothetical protein GCM10020255_008540 [Rhodococcus baikonurensis]